MTYRLLGYPYYDYVQPLSSDIYRVVGSYQYGIGGDPFSLSRISLLASTIAGAKYGFSSGKLLSL